MKKIVLASTSPRRHQLLDQLGLAFDVVAPDYEEDMSLDLPPEQLATKLASEKAMSVAAGLDNALVISADTFIVFQGEILGKPASPEHASAMLARLSGHMNLVYTGYAVVDTGSGTGKVGCVSSCVVMRDMSPADIDRYVATGEPLDKAGSYAVNGVGAMFVDRIDGDYSAIVGLPLAPVAAALAHFGIAVLGA